MTYDYDTDAETTIVDELVIVDMSFFLAFGKFNETGVQGYLPLLYTDLENI
jgi:hypothetical protein